MRVVHWNQIQLVDQEPDSDLQPASRKNCICFGRAATGLESPSHLKLKVSPSKPQDDLKRFPDSEKVSKIGASDLNSRNVGSIKSSLKRPASVVASVGDTERRKVQWLDVFGGELFEVHEFEPSEDNGSDDEFEKERICSSCRIM